MSTLTVELDQAKATLLREKARMYGLGAEEFVTASIEELIATLNRSSRRLSVAFLRRTTSYTGGWHSALPVAARGAGAS